MKRKIISTLFVALLFTHIFGAQQSFTNSYGIPVSFRESKARIGSLVVDYVGEFDGVGYYSGKSWSFVIVTYDGSDATTLKFVMGGIFYDSIVFDLDGTCFVARITMPSETEDGFPKLTLWPHSLAKSLAPDILEHAQKECECNPDGTTNHLE